MYVQCIYNVCAVYNVYTMYVRCTLYIHVRCIYSTLYKDCTYIVYTHLDPLSFYLFNCFLFQLNRLKVREKEEKILKKKERFEAAEVRRKEKEIMKMQKLKEIEGKTNTSVIRLVWVSVLISIMIVYMVLMVI